MYDLIIVGGGPSGASAGRVAGKAGLSTLLIEKEYFPRCKPCGGALSLRALSYLDFELPETLIERDISKIRINFKGHSVERGKNDRLAVLVSRSIFDNFLLEKARETGIEVRCGEKVLECEEREDCVEVKTTDNSYMARFVLIAEGSHGILKYGVRGARDRRNEYCIGLVTEIPESDDMIISRLPGVIDVHFGIARGGYGWIFPHKGYYSAGVVGTAKYLENPKQVLRDFLQANGFEGEYKFHGHKIPRGGIKRKVVNSRLLLSGDAAGFVDAFTGEGMAYAIRSGQLAAENVAELVLYDRKKSDLKTYESCCAQEFGNYLSHSLKLENIMHCFPETTFRIATSNKEILERYLEVAVMNKNSGDYVRWLLLNFKFG